MRKTVRLDLAISAWVSASRLIASGGGSGAGAGPGSATGVDTDVGAGVGAGPGSATGVNTDVGAGSGVGAGVIAAQADSKQAATRQRTTDRVTVISCMDVHLPRRLREGTKAALAPSQKIPTLFGHARTSQPGDMRASH